MKNLPLLLGTLAGSVLLMVGIAFFFSKPAEEKPVDFAVLSNHNVHVKGAQQPKVTVVEFSDFQCPACLASEPIVKELMEKHGQQVQFVYRHFPLSAIHPYADQVALYAEVAAVSDKFWEFHELAFANQAQWAELKSSPEVEQFFQEKMVTLGVDKSQFQERIKASSARDAVRSDVADATKLGVDSTPTFFVNGRKVSAPELISSVEALLQ